MSAPGHHYLNAAFKTEKVFFKDQVCGGRTGPSTFPQILCGSPCRTTSCNCCIAASEIVRVPAGIYGRTANNGVSHIWFLVPLVWDLCAPREQHCISTPKTKRCHSWFPRNGSVPLASCSALARDISNGQNMAPGLDFTKSVSGVVREPHIPQRLRSQNSIC